MTGYGVGIAFLIREYPGLAINISALSLVSLVLSLLLVFRTNSAYDRYWEGRKTWQDLKVNSRNLIRSYWVCVMEKSIEDSVVKRQAMKNVAAFIISIKHYLRGEDGLEHADYDGLLSPDFRLHFSTRSAAYNYGAIPASGSNSPEMILYELQKFTEHIQDNHLVHLQFYANLLGGLNTLGNMLGNCERIVSTPIPLAYRIHLHHALYLYLLILPWALGSMGLAKTIILQFVISFMMIGIDCISREIQNPFGYDANDLPLDAYCEAVLVELSYALHHRAPKALATTEDTIASTVANAKDAGDSGDTV
ncbi:Bestrophin/UPF0187 [Kickxella alabastrina]|uniref:Bestrophin/UPF0187 n=1 Tax=Kickxella alabastrina TaxID=61397 RepID=UPI00221FBDD1|nr:Bestrophin/UPF0187 [Kickxella alabastrina]KAI7831890.1 Bestrophin/UPF0187 [Kickxella alabastrina]